MKKLIIFNLLIFCLLTSCYTSFIQVFDTESTNTKLSNGYYIYENDTLKIIYSFWEYQGVMSFSLYNKLNKPIYLDWKNSSFIVNDNKFNYWIDETQTSQAGYYGAYFYHGPLIQPGYTITEGIQLSRSSTVKPERITFIPPKSFSTWSQFYLLPLRFFKIDDNCKVTVESRIDKPNKRTTVYLETFSLQDSPLRFRNFIAISFLENSQTFSYIDNEFYLTSVKEMDIRHFRGRYLGKDEKGHSNYEKPYKKKTSFYIKLSGGDDYEYRHRQKTAWK